MNINLTLFAQAVDLRGLHLVHGEVRVAALRARSKRARRHIAEGLAAAERGRQELEQAAAQAERDAARGAAAGAGDPRAGREARARRSSRKRRSRPRRKASAMIAGAKAEIEQEVSRARENAARRRSPRSRSPARRRSCAAKWTRRRTPTCSPASSRSSSAHGRDSSPSRVPTPKRRSSSPREGGALAPLGRRCSRCSSAWSRRRRRCAPASANPNVDGRSARWR